MTANEIIEGMMTLENPEKRKVLMGFFKTDKGEYGEGDQFLGLPVPETRLFVKQGKDLPLEEVQQLIDSPWHEVRLCGFLILVNQFERLCKRDTPETVRQRDELVAFYLYNAKRANNWDLTDLSCYKVVGRWLLLPSQTSDDEKLAIMDRLAASNNLWEQRISMVSTMATSMSGNPFYTLRYAEVHLHHPHDLMQKAVGWMLREMGKRCSMDILRDFLQKHAAEMPRTALRYAIEKMPQSERIYWLTRRGGGLSPTIPSDKSSSSR